MSEKKHPATPKRRQEARKKGQVLKSQELTTALSLLGFVAVLKFWMPQMFRRLEQVFTYVWGLSHDWTIYTVSSLMINLTVTSVLTVAPIFGVGLGIAVAGNYLQVGSLFSSETLKPQLSRISPLGGLKRMFGVRAWVELAKSLVKVALIGYFLYAAVRDNVDIFPALQTIDVWQGAILLGKAILSLAWKIAVSFLVLAVLDYAYQWWEYEKSLRMTQEELKQELKQTEGNPELKGAMKKRQRAMSLHRMAQDLKKADVVVTNPTHFAVALRYDLAEHNAPYVVAKGQDELALRLKQLAADYGIVVVENRPLARTLYAQTDIGEVIPPELFKAVAEVLAFVYRLKKKKPSLH